MLAISGQTNDGRFHSVISGEDTFVKSYINIGTENNFIQNNNYWVFYQFKGASSLEAARYAQKDWVKVSHGLFRRF